MSLLLLVKGLCFLGIADDDMCQTLAGGAMIYVIADAAKSYGPKLLAAM